MPEELDIASLLDNLDGFQLTVQNYQSIQNALETADNIQKPVVEKLLAICVPEMKGDLQFSANIVNIIFTILKKLKQAGSLFDLLPSLVGIFHVLKKVAAGNKVGALKTLCFDTIMHYPDVTMISLVENHCNELMDIINLYFNKKVPLEIRLQVINIIFKLLKILPPDKKQIFLAEGISIWFSKIIPFINNTPILPHILDTIELLVDELIHIDYIDNPHWKSTLECICHPQKYPAFIKSLLESHNENWHRVWIILIKLLKRQITESVGIGINPMLSVVEMAFKIDVNTRCKAFSCWKALIESFSAETNEMYIMKKVKLLIIPFTLNNAKVEESALAKLKAWYHLIYSFHAHLDKFSEMILTPFLHFCFGKPDATKAIYPPGMISDAIKAQTVEAFINIVDPSHCLECVYFPRLKGKILNTSLLINHLSDWIHCLYSALKICGANKNFTNEQILCLWKGFVGCFGEFPDHNVRRNLVNAVINVLNRLAEGCNTRMSDIIFIFLIRTLVEDSRINHLMVSKDNHTAPIDKIINIVLRLPINHLEKKQVINYMKPLTNYLVEQALITPNQSIECALKDVAPNGVLFWIALADTICEKSATLCSRTLCKIMLSPFGYMESFTSEPLATISWLNLYNFVYSTIYKSTINEDIFKAVMAHNGEAKSNIFILNIAIAAVRQKISLEDGNFEKETLWLLKSINRINQYQDIKKIFISLSELVVQIIKCLTKNHNEEIANNTVLIVIDILKLIKENDFVEHSTCYEHILKSLEQLIKIEAYSKLKLLLLNNLRYFSGFINKQSLRDMISNILGSDNDAKVKEVIKDTNKKQKNEIKVTTPNTKTVAKKSAKTEANIVRTVVENGEEFVVIKSNWKFNPKKLTDAQKEKLEQKRGDIPALYQDLSQSQDDFKLSVWKTDSQDTTTSSKSISEPGKEDISAIFKNLSQSEFVPKVLENIITQQKVDTKIITPNNNIKVDIKNYANKTQIEAKSPRLALKDRVYKNVQKLIKTTDASNVNSISTNNENIPMTPPMVKEVPNNVINSAPALMSTDRPSRLKRIPKKYADLELYGLSKRRSLGPSDDDDANFSTDLDAIDEPKTITDSVLDHSGNKESGNKSNATVSINKKIFVPESNESSEILTSAVQTEIKERMEVTDKIISKEDSINKDNLNAETDLTNKKLSINSPIRHNDNLSSPKTEKCKLTNVKKSSKKRKSRIEYELAIDMVEGHPFLNAPHSAKRVTRKSIVGTDGRRKKAEKLNNILKQHSSKASLNVLSKNRKSEQGSSIPLMETQNCPGEIVESQDIIESSQESTVTTISVKTHKPVNFPVVSLEKIKCPTQCTTQDKDVNETKINSNADIELPCNKTMSQEIIHLTGNKEVHNYSKVVTVEENIQCTAEAPTQEMDSQMLNKVESCFFTFGKETSDAESNTDKSTAEENADNDVTNILTPSITQNDITITMTESLLTDKDLNSPLQDEQQRKNDFLNNTQEISPIKNLSPLRENKSPSPETSSDYVVITLSSPVQASNGEPFDKCESPEVFTEEKSPDRLNQSPPREETAVKSTSPSLSLKRNRPQMRSNGRGAQMLGLCADVRMEEVVAKKSPSLNSSARRNLKMFNSSDMNETDEGEDSDKFLKMKRTIPANDCSPSGPILKRKLADITDEATASPASKRKRVSFHDPPVSTIICVKKYIEPIGIRSPQNSSIKRQERQLRSHLILKSPRKLDNVFKLDSVLNKAVESFSDNITPSNDTELTEQTPTIEVVKACDLNDIDPICPDLIYCTDSISNIATELSSPAMKDLLIKEFEGKVVSVGDLAKMTELEINRSCIKAPKVHTARKVLNEYLNKLKITQEVVEEMNSIESEANVLAESSEIQTDVLTISSNCTQTEMPLTSTSSMQTDESGSKSTVDITTCFLERTDSLETLCCKMDEMSKRKIAETLPFETLIEMFIDKVDASNYSSILNRVIEKQTKLRSANEKNVDKLSIIKDFLCGNFDNKDIHLFCSRLFKDLFDRS